MGYNDDQVAHWFYDQWKAVGFGKVKLIRPSQLVGFPGPGGLESVDIVDMFFVVDEVNFRHPCGRQRFHRPRAV